MFWHEYIHTCFVAKFSTDTSDQGIEAIFKNFESPRITKSKIVEIAKSMRDRGELVIYLNEAKELLFLESLPTDNLMILSKSTDIIESPYINLVNKVLFARLSKADTLAVMIHQGEVLGVL